MSKTPSKSKRAAPERRRGRGPSREKTAATRAAIVAAGKAALIERGYERTRMVDVAQAAGVAKGTLYLYFKTKQELFTAVTRDVVGDTLVQFSAPPSELKSVRDFIKHAALPNLARIEHSGRADIMRLMLREGSKFPEITESYQHEILDPWFAAIRQIMSLARARGELSTDAIERFPLLLMAPAVIATIWNGLFPDDQISAADMFEAHLDLVFKEPDAAK